MPLSDESGSGIGKHDADCLRRRGELGALLCSCGLSDDQVDEGVMVVLSPQARLVPTRATGGPITYPTLRIRRVDS